MFCVLLAVVRLATVSRLPYTLGCVVATFTVRSPDITAPFLCPFWNHITGIFTA